MLYSTPQLLLESCTFSLGSRLLHGVQGKSISINVNVVGANTSVSAAVQETPDTRSGTGGKPLLQSSS